MLKTLRNLFKLALVGILLLFAFALYFAVHSVRKSPDAGPGDVVTSTPIPAPGPSSPVGAKSRRR